MTDVWLSFETASSYEGSEVLGVSSTEELAQKLCEDRESVWGIHAHAPLNWGEDYPDQADGYVRRYSVRKFELDEGSK